MLLLRKNLCQNLYQLYHYKNMFQMKNILMLMVFHYFFLYTYQNYHSYTLLY